MKRFCYFLAAFLLIFTSFTVCTPAEEPSKSSAKEVICLEDGSRIVISTITGTPQSNEKGTSHVKNGMRVYEYRASSGTLLWKVTLTASFTYNGTTSACTDSSCSVAIYDSVWTNVSKSASKSGNTAYANFVMYNHYTAQTVSDQISLSCSKTGVLS